MIEAPIAISAEIMRAAARWPPRSAKLLADDQPAEPEDRRAVGADAVLHDRRLLALDPREQPAKVEDEEHDEGDAPEGDAEVRGAHRSGVREAGSDRGWPAIGAFSTAPVSPMAW